MSNTNEQSIDFYKKFQEIKDDMSKASLEDVENILDHYNQGAIEVNGVSYHYNINPLDAACLNARYKQLTGQDHPTFVSEQVKVLDEIIKSGGGISVDGKPTIYQRLKNNLTGEGLGISILPNKKDSYIDKFDAIKFDMSQASLDDIKDILDHYDQDSVLIDGIQYHFRPNALQGASLNARYKELTGQDHPTFVKAQEQILEEQIKNGQRISVGNPTVYEQLKSNNMETGNRNHILNRANEIILNPQEASLEDISSLLNHFNGKPVLIDGVAHHPFNDPMSASKLNARYKELTGQNHPVFTEQAPKVIDDLMKDKDMLIQAGAYGTDYFDKLEQIKQETQQTMEIQSNEESKKVFTEERDKQRQLDASVRTQQITAMQQANQNTQEMQQMISEATQDNSIGGMSR
jgi:hypothetical protein